MRCCLHPSHPGRVGLVFALLVALIGGPGCGDDDNCPECPAPAGTVLLSFDHVSEGVPLLPNQMIYTNAAGYQYDVTRFEYLLTDIQLERPSGERVDLATTRYENLFASLPSKAVEGLAVHVPTGEYSRVLFQWGKKWEGSIEATEVLGEELDAFKWTEPLGGGYHCMRFEGNYATPGDPPVTGVFRLHTGRLHATIPGTDPPERYERIMDPSVAVALELDPVLRVANGEVWNVEIVIDVDAFMTEDYDFRQEVDTESGRGTFPLSGPVMASYPAQELLLLPIDENHDGVYDGNVFGLGDVENITASP